MHWQLASSIAAHDHTLGHVEAPVTLVEYGSFQSPYCRTAAGMVRTLHRWLRHKVRFVFRHFPTGEANSLEENAAEIAELASARGMFWPMYDMLYRHQDDLDDDSLIGYAGELLRLDRRMAVLHLRSHVYAARVRHDIMTGLRSGVRTAPAFFVNGELHDGPCDEDSVYRVLERAIRDAGTVCTV